MFVEKMTKEKTAEEAQRLWLGAPVCICGTVQIRRLKHAVQYHSREPEMWGSDHEFSSSLEFQQDSHFHRIVKYMCLQSTLVMDLQDSTIFIPSVSVANSKPPFSRLYLH